MRSVTNQRAISGRRPARVRSRTIVGFVVSRVARDVVRLGRHGTASCGLRPVVLQRLPVERQDRPGPAGQPGESGVGDADHRRLSHQPSRTAEPPGQLPPGTGRAHPVRGHRDDRRHRPSARQRLSRGDPGQLLEQRDDHRDPRSRLRPQFQPVRLDDHQRPERDHGQWGSRGHRGHQGCRLLRQQHADLERRPEQDRAASRARRQLPPRESPADELLHDELQPEQYQRDAGTERHDLDQHPCHQRLVAERHLERQRPSLGGHRFVQPQPGQLRPRLDHDHLDVGVDADRHVHRQPEGDRNLDDLLPRR